MNINIVCPHCLEVSSVEKKEPTIAQECTKCGNSLLDAKPISTNAVILEHFIENSDLPLVVDFWAPWCGPCISMAPHFKKAALAMPLEAQFLKINNDNEHTLGSDFLIKTIPAVLMIREGKEIARFTGMRSSKQIQKWVREYI